MKTTMIHENESSVTVRGDGAPLFTYRYADFDPTDEAPRPIIHPIRTRLGRMLTASRPWDHRWHQGVSMTCAELSGCNFWGGPTYVRDQGYQFLENHGAQRHEAWTDTDGDAATLSERLAWFSHEGTRWIDEERTISASGLDTSAGVNPESGWVLSLSFRMKNVAGHTLEFGSPTTNGRPMAGYGGLFWRAPREFYASRILAMPDGADQVEETGEELMGRRSPFLAWIGKHDDTTPDMPDSTTIICSDAPGNPRHPTQWFVRTGPEPYFSASFMFDEVFPLESGVEVVFSYRTAIIDGALSPDEIETVAGSLRD